MRRHAKLIDSHAIRCLLRAKSVRHPSGQSVAALKEQVSRTLESYDFEQILPDAVIGPSGQVTVGKSFAGRRSIVILLPDRPSDHLSSKHSAVAAPTGG